MEKGRIAVIRNFFQTDHQFKKVMEEKKVLEALQLAICTKNFLLGKSDFKYLSTYFLTDLLYFQKVAFRKNFIPDNFPSEYFCFSNIHIISESRKNPLHQTTNTIKVKKFNWDKILNTCLSYDG